MSCSGGSILIPCRGEQSRLGGFGGTAGAVCLGLLSGDAVAVGPVLDNQIKRAWRECIMPSSA
jgi:hypothetical protein